MGTMNSNGRRSAGEHQKHTEESELVLSVSQGSIDAWQEFLTRYAGLVYSVARRYLPAEDEDDIRSVYVDVLKYLYDGDLQKYRGRPALSTWLFVYTERKAVDFWRAKCGRYREPKGLQYLNEFDREVLRLFFVERMSIDVVVHTLNWNGNKVGAQDIVASVQKIESALDNRYLKRLDREYLAKKNGADTARLLEYVVHSRIEYEKQVSDSLPDRLVLEREAQETVERVRALRSILPKKERQIIDLRFDQGLNARQISEKLDLGGQRKVYASIDRIIQKLRLMVASNRTNTRSRDE